MEPRDEQLWRLALKRARFIKNLSAYLIISGFLWAIWWFSMGQYNTNMSWPWPIWPMIGWGIGLAAQYFNAFGDDKEKFAERHYERMKRKKNDQ
jgi:hypothetical protein